ncbi:hypothetical protein AB2L27_04300 [Kineococcus sp. LSe6-4]|uniref:NAD glycohydrolase translocation F5/8 type C domain-containing protein n=1 Tax=Kineococcus halophytocola TaxID=3234027 RepID=A0ABV4H0H9_9ACTN
MPTTTTCSSCRAAMRAGDRFCWTCGTPRGSADRLEVVGPPAAQGRRRRAGGPVLAGVAALAVVAVGFSSWYLTRPDDDAAAQTPAPALAVSASPTTTPAATPAVTPGTASAAPTPTAPDPTPAFPTGSVVPVRASAPSTAPDNTDAGGRTTTYAVSHVLDGDPATAWRAEGDASGDTLVFTFEGPVRLTGVGLVNGFAKVDPVDGTDRYEQGRRITAVTWTFRTAEGPVRVRQDLRDGDRGMQTTTVAPVEVSEVGLTIDRTTRPGAGRGFDRTAISDVVFVNS